MNVDKHVCIENQIRNEIGNQLIKNSGLAVSIEGKVIYRGKPTLDYYRSLFPNADNLSTVYLTILKLSSELPKTEKDKLFLTLETQCAIYSEDYERAAELRDKLDAIYRKKADGSGNSHD